MKIAVLLGGTSPERHVSLASGKAIAIALKDAGHEVLIYDIALGEKALVELESLGKPTENAPTMDELSTYDNKNIIISLQLIPKDIDIAFLALHGASGEDGTVQAVLDLMGIKYTGAGVMSSSVAMDKAMSKKLFEFEGVPTPEWFCLNSDDATIEELEEYVKDHTDYPVVVKPNTGGSTVGLTIVKDKSELMDAYNTAAIYSSSILFEEFIEGRELTVPILGGEALPVIEIKPISGMYDYASKYTAGKTEYITPADLPLDVTEEVQALALLAHDALACGSYIRVDFRLDSENNLFCLEVNTLPGMTSTSLVPKSASVIGLSFAQLCEKIIELSLQ